MYSIFSRASDSTTCRLHKIQLWPADFNAAISDAKELSKFPDYEHTYVVNLLEPDYHMPLATIEFARLAHYFKGEVKYIIAHKDVEL